MHGDNLVLKNAITHSYRRMRKMTNSMLDGWGHQNMRSNNERLRNVRVSKWASMVVKSKRAEGQRS